MRPARFLDIFTPAGEGVGSLDLQRRVGAGVLGKEVEGVVMRVGGRSAGEVRPQNSPSEEYRIGAGT